MYASNYTAFNPEYCSICNEKKKKRQPWNNVEFNLIVGNVFMTRKWKFSFKYYGLTSVVRYVLFCTVWQNRSSPWALQLFTGSAEAHERQNC